MARYKLTQAIYSDAPGVGRVRAGRWICDNPTEAQPGDVVWVGVKPSQLPTGPASTITGSDSIDG
jgi:hypothetical protein